MRIPAIVVMLVAAACITGCATTRTIDMISGSDSRNGGGTAVFYAKALQSMEIVGADVFYWTRDGYKYLGDVSSRKGGTGWCQKLLVKLPAGYHYFAAQSTWVETGLNGNGTGVLYYTGDMSEDFLVCIDEGMFTPVEILVPRPRAVEPKPHMPVTSADQIQKHWFYSDR